MASFEGVAVIELPKYKSHKIVHALKIKGVLKAIDLDGPIIIIPEDPGYSEFEVDIEYYNKHKPQAGGYFVVYEDGYKSWSPAEAFESGYTKIIDIPSPLSELKAAIHADSDYAWTWLCNLACIGIDAGAGHEDSNRLAAQFMRNSFDVDVTQCENWKQFESQWANEKPSELAIGIAARVWCDDEMSNVVMDVEAANQIARIIERVIRNQES